LTGFHSEAGLYSGCRHTGHVRLKTKEQTVSQFHLFCFILILTFGESFNFSRYGGLMCSAQCLISSPDWIHFPCPAGFSSVISVFFTQNKGGGGGKRPGPPPLIATWTFSPNDAQDEYKNPFKVTCPEFHWLMGC